MKKFLSLSLTVLLLGIFLGFSNSDNPNSPRPKLTNKSKSAPIVTDNNGPNSTAADYYLDDFNAPNDTTALKLRGYQVYRNGTFTGTPGAIWFTGNPDAFFAFNGDSTDYVGSNFQSAGTLGDIDNWLVLPALNVNALDSICFYSRSPDPPPFFPDSIRVMFNPLGDTLPNSPSWIELGRFQPSTSGWELRSFVIPSSALGARLAIRYSVVDGGLTGANSNFIGIDALRVQGGGVWPGHYTFNVTLSGAQEVPPVATPGTGTLKGTYNEITNVIDFSLSFSGLLSPTNNAHFHAPAPRGVNAGVIIGFVPGFPLGVTSGNYDSSFTLTAGQETQLLAGLVYVNIHTTGFPGGELRGQLDSIGSNGTLPVELSSFASNVTNNNVNLIWTTATETNNSGFEILRAGSDNHWNTIDFIAGNNTTTTPTNYTFTDRNLNLGIYNYKLKQIDLNGNFQYFHLSNEVVIGVPVKFELSQNYPNPFNPSTRIDYQLPNDGNVSISVFDNSGKEIMTLVNEFKTAGYYTVNLNASSLSSGVYFYKISSDNFSSVKKMMLVK